MMTVKIYRNGNLLRSLTIKDEIHLSLCFELEEIVLELRA